jgi:hypothetical protein
MSASNGFHSTLLTLQTLNTHSWGLRATRRAFHHHSTCHVIKIQVEAKRLSWGHSFLVFNPAQVKARACYSWWLSAPRWSWWSGSFEAYRGDCGSPKNVLVTLYMVWAPPWQRWQTETPSEYPLSMWHGRWHNSLCVSQRGLGMITKSPIPREKIPLDSFTFKHSLYVSCYV